MRIFRNENYYTDSVPSLWLQRNKVSFGLKEKVFRAAGKCLVEHVTVCMLTLFPDSPNPSLGPEFSGEITVKWHTKMSKAKLKEF